MESIGHHECVAYPPALLYIRNGRLFCYSTPQGARPAQRAHMSHLATLSLWFFVIAPLQLMMGFAYYNQPIVYIPNAGHLWFWVISIYM